MKKLIGWVLAVVLLAGLLPMTAPTGLLPTAQAATYTGPTGGVFLAPIGDPLTDITGVWTAISNRAELEAMASNPSGMYFLANDIDLSGSDWIPIDVFSGVFHGRGYVIRNLTVTGDVQYAGLFGQTNGAIIKSVGLEGTDIRISTPNTSYAGGITGHTSGITTIENCYNKGSIYSSSDFSVIATYAYVGGICGYTSVTTSIKDCYNTGSISLDAETTTWLNYSRAYAGGICGYVTGINTIETSFNTGAVSVFSASSVAAHAAGIICDGTGTSSILNCYNTGSISATSLSDAYASGIRSRGGGTIRNCYNTGDISAMSPSPNAGGIVGSGSGTIDNCYNEGKISSDSSGASSLAGGIAGYISGTASNCHNKGNVISTAAHVFATGSASVRAGGISGYSSGTVADCYNTGNISSAASSVLGHSEALSGGISGLSYGTIKNCHNSGSVTSDSFSASSNTGRAYAYSGGICAANIVGDAANPNAITTTIRNCYNTGGVSSTANASSAVSHAYAGGISASGTSSGYSATGFGMTAIRNCYNTGGISADSSSSSSNTYVGGIFGADTASGRTTTTMVNCYNAGGISSSSSNAYGGGIFGSIFGSTAIANCYWNIDSAQTMNGSPQSPKKGAGSGTAATTSLTSTEMKLQISFTGFNFNDVWGFESGVNDDYPVLQPNSIDDNPAVPPITRPPVTPPEPGEAVIVPSDTDGAFIDLTAETFTLPAGFGLNIYSVNGGATELDVSDMEGTLTVWKGETGKKPRSEKQEITLG